MKNFFLKSNNRKDFSSKIGVSAGTIKNKAEAVKELLNIEENDSIYSIDFENDIIEVPNTGDNRHTEIFALIGGLSAISLAGAFIYDYKKKSRKKKNK